MYCSRYSYIYIYIYIYTHIRIYVYVCGRGCARLYEQFGNPKPNVRDGLKVPPKEKALCWSVEGSFKSGFKGTTSSLHCSSFLGLQPKKELQWRL